jgi:hypothetical protein
MKNKVFVGFLVLAMLMAILGNVGSVSAAGYGTAFVTAVTYQNVGTGPATINLSFYASENGTAIPIPPLTLAKNAGSSLGIGSLSQVSSGFKGSAVMSSDQPLVAVLVQVPPSGGAVTSRPLSSGFSGGSASLRVPTALKNQFGYTSTISIQNTDSVPNNLSVDFVPVSGTTIHKDVTALPAGAAKYYDLGTSDPIAAATFSGSVVVKATRTTGGGDGQVVATSLEAGTSNNFAYAFEGATQFSTKVYMPSAFCRYDASQYYSYYAVQNTDTGPVNVTVTYSNGHADPVQTIQPGAKFSFSGCGISNSLNPNGFIGSATITATGKIAAIAKIQNNSGLATAFLGFVDGASKISAPYVRWTETGWTNGSRQRAFLAIQNIGAADLPANSVTVKYFDKDGNLKGTHTISTAIAVGGKVNSNPTNANAGTEFGYSGTQFGGGAVIEGPAGSKLAVVVRVQGISSGEDYNGTPVQ